ncbi:MAG: Phospholipase 4 precursor [Myxococcales bacterium]|nr:Phospholipase 4 precursor [Myxococcales bacterium]
MRFSSWIGGVLVAACIGCGGQLNVANEDLGVYWPDLADSDDGAVDGGDDAADVDAGPSLEQLRDRCTFGPGDDVAKTIGFTAADRAKLPIDHVLVIMQENRSFDHYLGRLTQHGHPVDGIPANYTNPIPGGGTAKPAHATTTCISPDLPHSFAAIHSEWNSGKMDSFYKVANASGPGERAISWYDQTDIPFYYWVYSTFAMSDRFFSAVLGPTWPNRDYLYAATSDGVINTFERKITVPTIYDALDKAKIKWAAYADNGPRQDCISWTKTTPGFHPTADYFAALAAGTLPAVTFIDGEGDTQDEHPPGDAQKGEAFVRKVLTAAFASKQWAHLAIIMTYDEGGGFFDHVPPPPACVPSAGAANAAFNRMGVRLPMVVISPYSRPAYVSHVPQEITSITRFIELVYGLPAMTHRDANSSALLDLFDFTTPALLKPPASPAAGTGGCR